MKALQQRVEAVTALEPEMEALRRRLEGENGRVPREAGKGETLDDILPEAYAVVRETSRRTLGMRPFDVQVMGAIALHQGKIAEMKTGEGKTLAATTLWATRASIVHRQRLPRQARRRLDG